MTPINTATTTEPVQRGIGPPAVATSWGYPARAESVAHARSDVTQELVARGLGVLCVVTEIIVSELVTNAVQHASGLVHVRLSHTPTAVLCQVTDSSQTPPQLRQADPLDESGRGLHMVSQIADRWGWEGHPWGKTVWAEQALPADGRSSPYGQSMCAGFARLR